jgi:hypothetical protein
MQHNADPMRELYYWNHTKRFSARYLGIPTIESGRKTDIEIRALLPNKDVGFVNIDLAKEKGHAGSVRVLVYW